MSKISTQRVLAFIIDSIIISIINTLMMSLIEIDKYEIYSFELFSRNWVLNNNLYLFVLILYFMFFDFFKNGVSIGKSLLKLRIQSTNNNLNKIILIKRTLLKFLFLFSPLLLVVIIYYLIKETILYDNLTKTKVDV